MTRTVAWAAEKWVGLELLELSTGDDVLAQGVAIGRGDDPFAIRYRIACDRGWRARSLRIESLIGGERTLELFADGEGHWTGRGGAPIAELEGCMDVDLYPVAFTNTLPIRRLGLEAGRSATIAMAYVRVPELQFSRTEQRYTCLEKRGDGGRYRFEALQGGVVRFATELPADADGLIIDYPGFFRRVSG